jgi:hypothetical protein
MLIQTLSVTLFLTYASFRFYGFAHDSASCLSTPRDDLSLT